MAIIRVGVDLSKNVFYVHAVDESEKSVWKAKYRRSQWIKAIEKKVPKTAMIAMESCSAANYWARHLIEMGFDVKLISPQFVKPYVKTNKNDAIDAQAICEAASRPSMRFVQVKTIEQQDRQTMHRIRSELQASKVAKVNQIRGLSAEYGLFAPVGVSQIRKHVPEWLEDAENGLSPQFRRLLSGLYEDLKQLEKRIDELNEQIKQDLRLQPEAQRLIEIPGIGPLIASALLTVLNSQNNFKQGREFSASLGLTPQQHSTGGKQRLLGISKRGNGYLRKLLVHGARSIVRHTSTREDALSQWIEKLKSTKHINTVTVALANKLARIAWAVVTKNTEFNVAKAAL